MAFANEANAFFLGIAQDGQNIGDREIPDGFDGEEAVTGFFVFY